MKWISPWHAGFRNWSVRRSPEAIWKMLTPGYPLTKQRSTRIIPKCSDDACPPEQPPFALGLFVMCFLHALPVAELAPMVWCIVHKCLFLLWRISSDYNPHTVKSTTNCNSVNCALSWSITQSLVGFLVVCSIFWTGTSLLSNPWDRLSLYRQLPIWMLIAPHPLPPQHCPCHHCHQYLSVTCYVSCLWRMHKHDRQILLVLIYKWGNQVLNVNDRGRSQNQPICHDSPLYNQQTSLPGPNPACLFLSSGHDLKQLTFFLCVFLCFFHLFIFSFFLSVGLSVSVSHDARDWTWHFMHTKLYSIGKLHPSHSLF